MQPIANGERVAILAALFPFLDKTNLSGALPNKVTLEAAILSGLGATPMRTDELTNPPAAAPAGLLAATATTNGPQTILAAALIAGGLTELATRPRNITFTTGGVTPGHAPNQVVITGTDIDGNPLTETKALSQIAGIDVGVKAFAGPASFAFTGGTNTDATVSIGFGTKFGLSRSIKSRAGLLAVIREVAVGAVVTTGTFVDSVTSPPHGTYSPATAPDGTKSYAATYEYIVP